MSQEQPSLDNWNDFAGNYFKAALVKEWPALALVLEAKSRYTEDEKAQLVLEIEYTKKRFLYEPNVTNTKILRQACPESPKQLMGKKLSFQKVRARNPKTNEMVDSLEIVKIE